MVARGWLGVGGGEALLRLFCVLGLVWRDLVLDEAILEGLSALLDLVGMVMDRCSCCKLTRSGYGGCGTQDGDLRCSSVRRRIAMLAS